MALPKGRAWLPLPLLICWLGAVEARTTFSVRSDCAAVAGPGLEQDLTFFLSYFPGDGEAVLLTEIDFDPQVLAVASATSTAGAAKLHSGRIAIDYASAPLAEVAEDTLGMTVTPGESLEFNLRTYSSLAGEAEPAHESRFSLAVGSPIPVAITARPTAVYPGVPVELAMSIRNLDPAGRPVESLLWEWPEAVQVLDGARESELATPLEGGDSVAVILDLRARPGATERVSLKGMLVSRAVYGSPLPAVELELLPVPGASAAFSGGNALKGSTSELQFTWRNDSHASIPVREFRAPIPDSFRDISMVDGSGEAVRAEVESNPSEQAVSPGWPSSWPHLVVRPESGELAPGGRVQVTLVLRPTRSGLFACESAFYPEAGGDLIPLSGEVAVRVVEEEPHAGKQAGGAKPEARTDLEAVQGALQAQVRRELADFPLAAGSRIDLEAAKKDDRNWIAEDVLTAELIRKGYRVAVDSADEGGDSGASLSYRVVDARVVYMQKGWNPLAPKRRREAIGDLFLAFENTGRELSWIRRIQGYGVENVPSEGTQWLGGSETVDRVSVETGNKAVEIGISGLIVGGLFFVFFVP